MEAARNLNRKLVPKGLRLLLLRFTEKRALMYLYRPSRLSQDLSHSLADRLLREHGYDTGSCERCLCQLIRRLRTQKEFPHEIGLFLGYPPEDVLGYMEDPFACKCVGIWKVYGNEAQARQLFAQFKKCTQVYRDQWTKGKAIERLTVASS